MHQKLVEKALVRGATVRDLAQLGCEDVVEITQNGRPVLFKSGFPLPELNVELDYIAEQKLLTKEIFDRCDISTPAAIAFQDPFVEANRIVEFMEEGKLYVFKPVNGTEGDGVCMHIDSLETVQENWGEWKDVFKWFMLEVQAEGADLRIHAIEGKLVAAAVREPAFVLGNGRDTLDVLIESRRAIMETQNPENRLPIDRSTLELMAKQGVSGDSVIESGRKIKLKHVANMSLGAIATDVTDEIHPEYFAWIDRLAQETGACLFALDVMAVDHRAKPGPDTAWALEINARPHWLHHTFSERKQHDIASMMLDSLFGHAG